MANVIENPQYEAGIYQIETTDPVIGGINGVANVQAKQLANRTAYLKQIADEVVAARGGSSSLGARFTDSGISTYDGTATIICRGVISGLVATANPSVTRNLDLGSGRLYMFGQIVPFNAQAATALVPENQTGASSFAELYLWKDSNGVWQADCTPLGQATPADGLALYQVTIPNNNTAQNDTYLANCTLTRICHDEPGFPVYFSAAPSIAVTLPTPMADTNYTVVPEVDSFIGNPAQMGNLTITNKTVNGFSIASDGAADAIAVRWLAR